MTRSLNLKSKIQCESKSGQTAQTHFPSPVCKGGPIGINDLHSFRNWPFHDVTICSTRFRHILGISRQELSSIKRRVAEGHLDPLNKQEKQPSVPLIRDDPQHRHADAFLNWLYTEMAEPLAEGATAEGEVPFVSGFRF